MPNERASLAKKRLLRFTREQDDQLIEIASERGESVSTVIREAVRRFVKEVQS